MYFADDTDPVTFCHVIVASVADPGSVAFLTPVSGAFLTPGSGAFLTPGSGVGKKKTRSGSGIRIWDENPGTYFQELRNIFCLFKYLNSVMRIRIRDPESFYPGIRDRKCRIRDPEFFYPGIRDKHPGSATLVVAGCCNNNNDIT